MNSLPQAFVRGPINIALDRLLPTHIVPEIFLNSDKFKQIVASIKEVGLIEPVIVSTPDDETGMHTILDGHLRLLAAQKLSLTFITCLIAVDDESFTYNKRVSRLAPIQEHFMILRALDRGVNEHQLARALNVNLRSIQIKRNLLDGICPEVVDIMKDKQFDANVMRHIRKMKPARQIEAAELMVSLNNYSASYAAALLAATPAGQLLDQTRERKFRGVTADQMARMEHEMSMVQSRFKAVEQDYGTYVLNMVVARGYISKLLENDAVVRFLRSNYPDFLKEFRAIIDAGSLDERMNKGLTN